MGRLFNTEIMGKLQEKKPTKVQRKIKESVAESKARGRELAAAGRIREAKEAAEQAKAEAEEQERAEREKSQAWIDKYFSAEGRVKPALRPEVMLACPECGKEFRSKMALGGHRGRVHYRKS